MAIGRPLNLTPNIATKNISVVATAGQTVFTVTGGYRINEIAVYRNGTRLVDGRDFTALDGVIITLVSAATEGDVLEFSIFDSFNVSAAVNTSGDSTINGELTATKFIGDVTGNVSGSSGSSTGNAAGLTGTPDITINNLVGVAATFTGAVTYEDVTNIDSVGVVTAGKGFRATTGGLIVTAGVTTVTDGIELGASGVGGTITGAGNAEFAGITTSKGNLNVGTGITAYASTSNLNVGTGVTVYGSTGIVSATAFYGDGAALSGVVSGIEVMSDGSSVGTSLTALNFSGATITTAASGITTITIAAAGLSTAAGTSAGIVTTLYLSDAQDHKMTASGITTITCSGGTEGESHTLRITNSGITTIGFSTYFLWPSGSPPSIPSTDGAINLISFTVQRVGTAGTQLLAGASLDFS